MVQNPKNSHSSSKNGLSINDEEETRYRGVGLPGYVKNVDPRATRRLEELVRDFDNMFSPTQLVVLTLWRRNETERVQEAAERAEYNRERKKEPVKAEVESNANRRRKITNWD